MDSIENDCDACLNAMLLSAAQVFPAVLNAAIELNLFEIINQAGPNGISPSEIASKLPTQHAHTAHRLDRMLFLLACHSLLTCSKRINQDDRVERLYQLSPTGGYLLTDNDGASYVTLSRMLFHPDYFALLQNFKEVILDGGDEGLFKKVHGLTFFKYMETDNTLKPLFHGTMADTSTMHMRQILEKYKGFEEISTLVDVGGGIGQSLKMITSKYPLIKGINFDLPIVVEHAPLHPGIEHVGGDMFKSVPKGDAIMMKSTIHNWSDEECIQILKNCHESLKDGGKVIIIDLIKSEVPKVTDCDKYAAIIDNVMFLLPAGKERTEKEFEALRKGAGFSRYEVACRVFSGALGVIEFYK